MPSAALLGYRGCRGGVDLAGAIGPFDLPTVEPVPDRGYRAVGRLRHLTQRGPAGLELLEQLLVGSSARREPACHDPNTSSGGGRSATPRRRFRPARRRRRRTSAPPVSSTRSGG